MFPKCWPQFTMMSKSHFDVKQVNYLGRTITPNVVARQADKVKNLLSKLHFPKSKKAQQWYKALLNYIEL